MPEATEYRAADGSRLFIQYEIAEGQEVIDETFSYRMRNPDRMIGVRLLHEVKGVKSIVRLCPEGTRIGEWRQEDWSEPVNQFITTDRTQPIVINPRSPE
jgi:hypothetical protein